MTPDSSIVQSLAFHGGPRAVTAPIPPWPPTDGEVREALAAAFAAGDWGRYTGPYTKRLSRALRELHGLEHVTLCSSGTIAVELALRGLGVGPGDEVILAGYDFPGNFRAIESVGARPVLVDIRPQTWRLDERLLGEAAGPATKAIIVSHLHGDMVPMADVMETAKRHRLAVLEDACQTPGGRVDGRTAGSWGDAAVLSFGGSKLLTAGRGGAVLTRGADVHQRIKLFNDRGNLAFPLSELQAAVLIPQLDKLESRNARRRDRATRLYERLSALPGLHPLQHRAVSAEPAYYKLAWLYQPEELADLPIDDFVTLAQAEGAPIDKGFRGFTLRSSKRCRKAGPLAQSQTASVGTLLLHHPPLLGDDALLEQLVSAFTKIAQCQGAGRTSPNAT